MVLILKEMVNWGGLLLRMINSRKDRTNGVDEGYEEH